MSIKYAEVHLIHQSSPCTISNVRNTYTKDGMFCVMYYSEEKDIIVDKFPIANIFRVREGEVE